MTMRKIAEKMAAIYGRHEIPKERFLFHIFFLSSTFHAGTKEYRPNISEKKRQENKSSQKINKVQNDDENATEKTKSAYEEIWFLFEQQPFMWKCV